ncbi:MAG: LacI family DNA-binding transcriptional regulator [Fimbriimonadaceae bacterium]|nr:LacI family DNA-binding transcriptional regulator [Fimbriimonadaceae bacterium]
MTKHLVRATEENMGVITPQNKKVTLKDIAQAVNVSPFTVSVVLNGSKSNTRVSEATRERILDAAREMGYLPNALARALRNRTTNILGLYFGYGHLEPHDPFHAEVLTGLQRGCEKCEKDLMIHYSFHRYGMDEIFAELAGGKIDGLVLIASPHDPLVERLRGSQLSFVAMTDIIPGVPSVIADDAAGSVEIAKHLAQLGHKTVMYRSCPGESDSASRRERAFIEEATKHGIQTISVQTSDWKGGLDKSEIDLIENRKTNGVTAAVCWGDPSAHALLSYCKSRDISVPDDLAVVGFNGIELPFEPAKVLTTVRANWAKVAQQAVQLLVDQLDGEKEIPDLTVLPVEFCPGATS